MFKEIAYIACVLGLSIFGTELVFRLNPENKTTNAAYNLQSDMVLAASVVDMMVSFSILKVIHAPSTIKMKAIAFCLIGLFISAIVLRAKYQYFGPLEDVTYNVYNSTSFFLIVTTCIWIPFLFYKKHSPPLEDTVLPTTAAVAAVNRSNDIELDESLPSYYELPMPPAYSKVTMDPQPSTITEEEVELGSSRRVSNLQGQQRDRRPESSTPSTTIPQINHNAALTTEAAVVTIQDQ